MFNKSPNYRLCLYKNKEVESQTIDYAFVKMRYWNALFYEGPNNITHAQLRINGMQQIKCMPLLASCVPIPLSAYMLIM